MELDLDYIKINIQKILDRNHTDVEKRKIKVKHDRLSFACPICGDSQKNPREKRGHLFFNNLYYRCYNEDCRSTFTNLCSMNKIQLDITKKIELLDYIDTNFKTIKVDDISFSILDKLINITDLEKWFKSGNGPLRKFKKVVKNSEVYNWLSNRKIPENIILENFYEGVKVLGNGKWTENYVVFVNKINDKVLGFQERNLKSKQFRKFDIWQFDRIYNSIFDEKLDSIEAISYNKLSMLYGILNVDFENTLTIFEGYLDSLFFPNSIGMVGINTEFEFLKSNDVDVRLFFDNDNTGHLKSQKWINNGYSVFLWNKLIDELSLKERDPFTFKKWFNTNITDLNKLMELYPLSYNYLAKFFSKDEFDKIYLNKVVKTKYKTKNKTFTI